MKVIFSANFIGWRKEPTMMEIGKRMRKFFDTKSYCDLVGELHIMVQCSPIVQSFKRPRYYEDEYQKNPYWRDAPPFHFYHILYFDIPIGDNKTFQETDEQGGWNFLARLLLSYFQTVRLPVKLRKAFDLEGFRTDLHTFFVENGCEV